MLKKISALNGFKKLNKGEQSDINAGHFPGLLCKAQCYLRFNLCKSGCLDIDVQCHQECFIDLRCCKDVCPPEGGQVE